LIWYIHHFPALAVTHFLADGCNNIPLTNQNSENHLTELLTKSRDWSSLELCSDETPCIEDFSIIICVVVLRLFVSAFIYIYIYIYMYIHATHATHSSEKYIFWSLPLYNFLPL
jgi:hypothetical protein